jgi:DNA polymerase I-like protein with 3'-5' exonuclease and polymerase domains
MRLVLDVENTTVKRDGKMLLDPFEPGLELVQVGTQNVDNPDETNIYTLNHKERQDVGGLQAKQIQILLDHTTLLIMHNAQHDLMWLWESGFKYDGEIYDTMLAEYLLLRGQKEPLSMDACAERRQLEFQKDDTLKRYFKDGYNTNEIPLAELSFYLRRDLDVTRELFLAIEHDFAQPESASLHKVREVTFNTCKTLTRMYMSGIRVDRDALQEVRLQFEQEKADIEERLARKTRELMGDTPINLNSPEQVSQVVFSRRILNKKEWAALYEYVETPQEFKAAVEANSTIIKRTKAFTCPTCKGEGKTYKTKKDGTRYARPNKCVDCDARGYQLKETNHVAGLCFTAPSKKWVSANGFSTSKDNLDVLMATAKSNNMDSALSFLADLKRLSAISSYLSSFVDGISVYTKPDGFLHVSLTQHITSTGRFSGRNPNMQNMPRGGTFPVKKVFVSRWEGGQIMEADFAQLEFRAAAFLSQDKVAMEEIATGFDVHSYTAKVISDAGEPTTRQEAKAHTFAPLFGATGYGRSKAVAAYYEHFTKKYDGVAKWHKELGNEAMRFMKITNVSGRQYAFPDVTRRSNGSVTHFTMIKNYPVQGFATGDVVPVVLIEIEKNLQGLHSCVVNSVHDSVVIDVHPDETDQVIQVIKNMNNGLNKLVEDAYGVTMNVPLLLEAKLGPNWLENEDVA